LLLLLLLFTWVIKVVLNSVGSLSVTVAAFLSVNSFGLVSSVLADECEEGSVDIDDEFKASLLSVLFAFEISSNFSLLLLSYA
jgi:hypothetical protein